jgi:hypothetical protein
MRMFPVFVIAFVAVVISVLVVSFIYDGARFFVDALFVVGGVVTAVGAFIAAGFSKPSFGEWYGHSTKDPDRQVEIFLEYRKAQWRHGLFILIFGLALICLSVIMGIFLRV